VAGAEFVASFVANPVNPNPDGWEEEGALFSEAVKPNPDEAAVPLSELVKPNPDADGSEAAGPPLSETKLKPEETVS